MTAIARRIVTALAGPAVAAGVLAGAIALGAPANAAPIPTDGMTCTTAKVAAPAADITNLLTRPGQLDAASGQPDPVGAPTSCIGR